MNQLFSHPDVIEALVASPKLAAFFDFDGTLVPIADAPDHIVVSPKIPSLLTRLSRKKGRTVGIVSGRSIADLTSYLHLPNSIRVAGNHGLEWVIDGTYHTVPLPGTYIPSLRALYDRLTSLAGGVAGASAEWKELTVSCHLRQVAPDAIDALRTRILQEIRSSNADGIFSVIDGLRDVDVRPAVSWTKADALRQFFVSPGTDDHSTLLYVGDDVTDEDVFAVFPGAVTVHVGTQDSKAKFRLRDVDDVISLLGRLT